MVTKGTTSRLTKGVTKSLTADGASGGSGGTPLLDVYTGAAAAYSLRKLRSDYTGACLRVRRSSDSAEQDIGLGVVALDYDLGHLSVFCRSLNTIPERLHLFTSAPTFSTRRHRLVLVALVFLVGSSGR